MANQLKIKVKQDNATKLRSNLKELQSLQLEVGVFGDEGFYSMIANVHEFGMTINAKGSFLTIPTPEAGDRRPRDIDGLFRPKGKNVLAVSNGNELTVMFILKESVNIPERSFIRSTFDEKQSEWQKFVASRLDSVIDTKMSGRQLLELLGAKIQSDIQQKITSLSSPPNSPLTAANKGSKNPLVDTGGLRQRVTWKVS